MGSLPPSNGGDFHCFLKGTRIRTADGERKIEDLAVGDLLPTVFGGVCPIQWIGRYRYRKCDPAKPWVRNVMPIRIARSALGPNIPHANLYISEAHALLIDGALVAAGNLVNDTTITRYEARELDELGFFHIKLERHDVIYAEGAPTETLLEVDESAVNFAEYLRQYGPVTTEETPCAPLFRYGYRRGEIKSCFRSAISPWIDRRQRVDIIRDELDARGIALLRSELTFAGPVTSGACSAAKITLRPKEQVRPAHAAPLGRRAVKIARPDAELIRMTLGAAPSGD
jgi:hypothetical protein